MARRGAQLGGPVGPNQRLVLVLGGHGHELELGHALGAMPIAGAHTVRASVTPADDNHMLAICTNLFREWVARIDLVLHRQKLHGEVHAVEFTARHGKVARLLGTAGQHHCIVFLEQGLGRDGFFGPVGDLGVLGKVGHQHAGSEDHTLGLHLCDPPIDLELLHFEVGNAIAE